VIVTDPPVWADADVSPEDNTKWPPTPLFPDPTITLIDPAWPPLALPDSREIDPVLPTRVVPVLRSIAPDRPDDSAFAVDTTTVPVDELLLPPDVIDTDPPVAAASDAAPPSIRTLPPVWAAVVDPADRRISPPTPLSPPPTIRLMEPPRPPLAVPDWSNIAPELPANVAPVLSSTSPLTPPTPAGADATAMEPEVVAVDRPDVIETLPPVCADPAAFPASITMWPPNAASVVRPADKVMEPPSPLVPVPTTTLIAPP
jgi:hypothetical protein